jgi:hypothetical protein
VHGLEVLFIRLVKVKDTTRCKCLLSLHFDEIKEIKAFKVVRKKDRKNERKEGKFVRQGGHKRLS